MFLSKQIASYAKIWKFIPFKPEECETDQNATVIIKSISSIYFSLDNT